MDKAKFLLAILLGLVACGPAADATPEWAFSQTKTADYATTLTLENQLTPTLYGPETMPVDRQAYPATLNVEDATMSIQRVIPAPSTITLLPEVQAILAKHTQLAREAGLVFSVMRVKYVPDAQRWFLVPVASDGTTIAGWLEIADPTSQTGFRYAEQPTWDSQFKPTVDTYTYGLPDLHRPSNHFVVGFAYGFPILIEVTRDGVPQYWNDVAGKTMQQIEGAQVSVPEWQTTIETQDPMDRYFTIIDGAPVIDRYNTPEAESVVLVSESIKNISTTDGLNPNIIAAKDKDGNAYAFNPDHGWFALPDVQMDYIKLESYTQVTQAFIEDGRANITTALLYAENPTIPPDAIDPVYWVTYSWMDKVSGDKIPTLCNNACGLGYDAKQLYPEEWKHIYYYSTNKPFAWTGFYRVQLDNEASIYVVSRTLKNPSATNPNQTINLFYGFDKATYENMVTTVMGSGRTVLKINIDGTDNGVCDLAVILPPPSSIDGSTVPFRLSPDDWITGGNPVVAGLQQRGELISEFDPINLQIILKVLREGRQQKWTIAPLSQPLPAVFSKYIFLAGFINQ